MPIGAPCSFCVSMSCMKAMPTALSPSAVALTGAMPDLVYWLMFLCRLFRNAKPLSSPRRWTVVARKT